MSQSLCVNGQASAPNLYAFDLRRPLVQDSSTVLPGHRLCSTRGVLPAKLGRYAAVATLLLKRRPDLITPESGPPGVSAENESAEAQRLAKDLEKLGPTFIKLGQVLSTRADLLPPSYLDALSRLQDNVAPIPAADIQKTIEEDLNVRVSKAFLSFDEAPLASASLGQVHRATLRDGRPVAVKVQRPGVLDQVLADLTVLDEIAAFVDSHTKVGKRYEFAPMIHEFRKSLMEELDYTIEANHLRTLKRNLEEFQRILVPAPIESYVSKRVLAMEYVTGTKVTGLNPVALIDVDPEGLADELIQAYLQQILLDGFFHADPHPGNVFITEDGRLALIDLGMVGHLSPTLQDKLLKLILAISEGRGEEAADAAIALGEKRDEFDEESFKRDVVSVVGHYFGASLKDFQVGRIVLEVNQSAGAHGVKSPVELTMLGKMLLTLDNIARTLAPTLDVNASIRKNASSLMQRRLLKSLSPGTVFTTVLEAKEFAEQLPRRINRVLESLASSQLKLKVEVIDEGAVIDGLQKVANRITMGLVVAALIVSAAMMMRIESRFTLFGYPGFPAVLMLVASSLAGWLVFNIVAHDRAPRSKTR
ncbi:MAG TPA: AarF/ABC1/UbiB kinase family protein [Vicinamibacterales bacterium]|nr:AarF/ABC1/UbiB kinase family protein [Vicinamibacterales bacterium]